MKEVILELMQLCPGRIDLQIDRFKLFGETAAQYIESNPREFEGIKTVKMIKLDTIVRVQANPVDKKMESVAYSHDVELAFNECLRKIKKFKA